MTVEKKIYLRKRRTMESSFLISTIRLYSRSSSPIAPIRLNLTRNWWNMQISLFLRPIHQLKRTWCCVEWSWESWNLFSNRNSTITLSRHKFSRKPSRWAINLFFRMKYQKADELGKRYNLRRIVPVVSFRSYSSPPWDRQTLAALISLR